MGVATKSGKVSSKGVTGYALGKANAAASLEMAIAARKLADDMLSDCREQMVNMGGAREAGELRELFNDNKKPHPMYPYAGLDTPLSR